MKKKTFKLLLTLYSLAGEHNRGKSSKIKGNNKMKCPHNKANWNTC